MGWRSAIVLAGFGCAVPAAAGSVPVDSGSGDIILTREQAEHLSPRELEATLLPDFPHGPIRKMEVGQPPKEFGVMPLGFISFDEVGTAIGGRLCAARRILVIFDTLDGGLADTPAEQAENAPRRRFHVGAAPRVAVLPAIATDSACAQVERFAQMSEVDAARGRDVIEVVLDLSMRAARSGRLPIPVTCVDETMSGGKACDGVRALGGLDWRTLGNVALTHAGKASTGQLDFWSDRPWVVEATGYKPVTSLRLRRQYPAPF